MAGNRKAAEAVCLQWVDKIDPSNRTGDIYRAFFKEMNDETFDQYITALAEGRDFVAFILDNLTKHPITTENNFQVAEEMGVSFFHYIWTEQPETGQVTRSNQKYLCLHVPVRRQIQTLINKISVPEDNKHVDDMTDQVAGPISKASSISMPELMVLYSTGHEEVIKEFIKYRGGDLKGMREIDRLINTTGGAKMSEVDKLGTTVKATETLDTLLRAMHLESNFSEK